jgi:hypothetical protein
VIGAGAVDAWVRSSAPSVDLQATISEVRPDGKETFVQNGWVRGIARALDPAKSTPLEPVLSLRESDFSPFPADRFVETTIPLYYEGHVYRAGSRIRVTIAAPNGTQPIWAFAQTQPEGTAEVAIAYGEDMPSHLLLPVVPGVEVPTDLPPCPGLRGEPCRDYLAFANQPADLRPAADGGGPPAPQGEQPAQGGEVTSSPGAAGPVQRSRPAAKCRRRHRRRHRGKSHHRRGSGPCHRKPARR